MFKKIRELAVNSFIYGLSTVVTRFISIFLIPIYTAIFTPANYGVINLVNTSLMLTGIIVVAGLDNAASRWYWLKETDEDRHVTFSSWFWSQLTIGITFSVIVGLSSLFLARVITGDSDTYLLFILAAANLPLNAFILVFTTWFRVRKKPVPTVLFSLLNSVLTVGLSIFLVVYKNRGLEGVFLSQLISNLFCATVAAFILAKHLSIRYFSIRRVREMLIFSLPLVPTALAFWFLNSAGSFFINYFNSKSDVGLFQIGVNIASICGMVFWAFLQAWSPFAMSIHKESSSGKIYSVVLDLYCALGGLFVLSVFLFAPEILMLVATRDYVGAALIAGILSINIFISNMAQITAIGASIRNTSAPYLYGVILAGIASLVLFIVLIPLVGKEGAALSTLIGNIIFSIYVTVRAQKLHYIPYNFRKNSMLILAIVAICAVSFYLKMERPFVNPALKGSLLSVFILVALYLNRGNLHSVFQRFGFRHSIHYREK